MDDADLRLQSLWIVEVDMVAIGLGVSIQLGYALREYGAYNYLYREDSSSPLILFVLSQVFIYVCPSVALTISRMTLC